jgi:hypothetical protein
VSDYLLHELAAPLVIDETLPGTAGEPFVRDRLFRVAGPWT